jgi:hypothetical protein
MELTLLIKSIMGLVVLLLFLVFFLYIPFGKERKKEKIKQAPTQKNDFHLEDLHSIVKNKTSTSSELKDALERVIQYHGKIDTKLGSHPDPKSDIYMDILFKAALHPNIEKKIIIKFNKDLEKLNPEYKKEINDALMSGLNSRSR